MKRITIPFLLLTLAVTAFCDEKKAAKSVSGRAAEKKEETPPKTLEEAHQQLEKLLPKEELAKIDAMKSQDEMIEYHFSLGMSMRNNWGLWGGGPLAKHLIGLGFTHPDDMSCMILETFWCKRHEKEFRLKERAAYNAAYWKAAANPPDTAKDPKDGSEIDWNMSFVEDDDKKPRQLHIGKSKKTGRWLVYEHDKGVYEPSAALLKRISDSEKTDPFAPNDKPAAK